MGNKLLSYLSPYTAKSKPIYTVQIFKS